MSGSARGSATGSGWPLIHTVLRPSLRRTNPVTRALPSAGAGTSASPRRSRSRRARSSGEWNSDPSSVAPAAVAARKRARSRASGRAVATPLPQGDPFHGALGLDARLQLLRSLRFQAPQRAAVHRVEALPALRQGLDEREHVALVQSA